MAYNDEVLVYNSHGKEYEVPRVRVHSIYDLQRGDHIAFHRYSGVLWHHAILEDVDTERGEIQVIEYTNTLEGFIMDNCIPPKSPGIAKVVRNKLKFHEITVYLMIHEQCFDPETVVWRAQNKVGKGKYNPITNNCEHFAMWCKTGRSSSDQVNKATEMFGKQAADQTAYQTTSHFVKTGGRMATRATAQAGRVVFVREGGRMAGNEAMTRAASQAGGVFIRRGTEAVTSRAAAQAGRTFVRTGVSRSVSSAGQEMAMASSAGTGVGGAIAGGALAAGVEGLSMLYDFSRVESSLRAGRISEDQFNRTVRKRIVSGTGNVAGSTTGVIIGQAIIPVPILGGFVGGVIGGLSGSFIGNIFGNVLFD